MLNDPAAKALETLDVSRLAVAFLRAIRDEQLDDAELIFRGVPRRRYPTFAIMLARYATHDGAMTDEMLDEFLRLLGEDEVSGRLVNMWREDEEP